MVTIERPRRHPQHGWRGRKSLAFFVYLAACFSACDATTDQRDEPATLSATTAAPTNKGARPGGPSAACVGVTDGTSPAGCDGFFKCAQQECIAERCVIRPAPGLLCRGPRPNDLASYVCDQSGACVAAEPNRPQPRR
jgi:hypothetical protein